MNKQVVIDPFSHEWVQTGLAALAARARAGEPEGPLRDELFETLWPWARQMADRAVRRLPPRSDCDETRSQLLFAVWQATQRIDWDRYSAWPSMLRRRVLGAKMDAARADDPISRRHRQAFSRASAAIAHEEQVQGRHLDAAEREEVARGHFSEFARPGLYAELCEVARHHDGGGDAPADTPDARWDPERAVLDAELSESVRTWVQTLPRPLVSRLAAWWQGGSSELPRSLSAKLVPFGAGLSELVR